MRLKIISLDFRFRDIHVVLSILIDHSGEIVFTIAFMSSQYLYIIPALIATMYGQVSYSMSNFPTE